jgi:hypothetical protein
MPASLRFILSSRKRLDAVSATAVGLTARDIWFESQTIRRRTSVRIAASGCSVWPLTIRKRSLEINRAFVREKRIRLNTLLRQSDAIKTRVEELKRRRYGANWLYRSLINFRKTYPAELLAALCKLAVNKEDDGILNALVDDKNRQGRLEQVTQLHGLGIFATDIRDALIENILKPLIQLEEIAKDADPKESLSRHCQWADSLDEQFAYAEYLVKEGQAFFDSNNLERLNSIPLSENNVRLTRSLQWSYDKSMAKRK